MQITFKDVGHGDSIIVEWKEKGQWKIGIIDCKLHNDTNPVLDYIIEKGYELIEFIVLSHPHTDHYTGFPALFRHCLRERIRVKKFYNSLDKIETNYWEFCNVEGVNPTREIGKVIDAVQDLSDANLLEKNFINFDDEQVLNKNLSFTFLAPHENEILGCQHKIKYGRDMGKKSAAANLISTLILINYGGKKVLLTSDVETDAFERIIQRHPGLIFNERLNLCQIPHHGSENNLHKPFWNRVKKIESCPAVISSGNEYDLPSEDVIQEFHNQGFRVHCTNPGFNGMNAFLSRTNSNIESGLNTFSEIHEETRIGGDKIFEFKLPFWKRLYELL